MKAPWKGKWFVWDRTKALEADGQADRAIEQAIGPTGDEPLADLPDLDIGKWFEHPKGDGL